MSVAATVVAPASPAVTWRRFTDFGRWPEWNPHCLEAEVDGPLAPGTELGLRLRHPRGRDFYTRPRLTEVEPGRRVAWAATAPLLRATVTAEFAPEPDGTRVQLVSESTGGLAFAYRMTLTERAQAVLYVGMLDALTDSLR